MVEALRGIRPTGQENGLPTKVVSLGQRIRAQRELLQMNQTRFSVETGLSQGHLSQVEQDEVGNLGYKTVIVIAQALGAGIDFFEGKLDTKVFLKPEARKLYQIISSLELDNDRRRAVKRAVRKLIPETDAPRIEHVELVSREKTIGEIFCDARARAGAMTQGELARKCNLSQGYLSQFESSDVDNPSLHTIRKISEGLNIDVYRFLGIQGKVYPREIKRLDRFLRSDHFTAGQKAVILNRLIQIVSIIQPLLNRIEPVPQELQIK